MGMFDESEDDALGGTTLAPSPVLDPVGQQHVPPPDVTPLVSSMPRLPMPAPPPMPTGQLDGKQKLLALLTAGFAIGAGPHSGMGTGALHGLAESQAQQQQNSLNQWKVQAGAAQQQSRIVEQQQAELDRQRALRLQTTFENFRKELPTVQSEDEYRQKVQLYAGGLQAAGYRISPDYFYQNFKYTPPTDQQAIQKGLNAYFANPMVKELLKVDPGKAYAGAITYTTMSDGQKQQVRLPIADAMKALGQDLNVSQGEALFSTAGKGSEIQQALGTANAEFTARFGREPDKANPKDNDWLTQRAHALTTKPPTELDTALKQSLLKQRQTQSTDEGIPPERVAATAQAILENRMAPSQLSLGGGMGKAGVAFKQAVMGEILRINPKFNFQEAESNFQFGKNVGTQNTVRYLESVKESIPLVIERATKLANGNIRSLNKLMNAGKNQFNDVDLKKFKTDTLFVADEIAKILQGGGTGSGTSDAKLKQAESVLNDSDSPQAIAAALSDVQQLLEFRQTTLTRGTFMEKKTEGPEQPKAATPLDSAYEELKKRRAQRGG